MERSLFVLQRLSAALLGVLVIVHIGVILYASQNGLTGAEILDRTRGNGAWALFYFVFVFAASIHAPIGLRNILNEWTPLPRVLIDIAMAAFACALTYLGSSAVMSVFSA